MKQQNQFNDCQTPLRLLDTPSEVSTPIQNQNRTQNQYDFKFPPTNMLDKQQNLTYRIKFKVSPDKRPLQKSRQKSVYNNTGRQASQKDIHSNISIQNRIRKKQQQKYDDRVSSNSGEDIRQKVYRLQKDNMNLYRDNKVLMQYIERFKLQNSRLLEEKKMNLNEITELKKRLDIVNNNLKQNSYGKDELHKNFNKILMQKENLQMQNKRISNQLEIISDLRQKQHFNYVNSIKQKDHMFSLLNAQRVQKQCKVRELQQMNKRLEQLRRQKNGGMDMDRVKKPIMEQQSIMREQIIRLKQLLNMRNQQIRKQNQKQRQRIKNNLKLIYQNQISNLRQNLKIKQHQIYSLKNIHNS